MNWQTDISKIETPHEEIHFGIKVMASEPVLLYFPDDPFGQVYQIARLTRWANGVERFYLCNSLQGTRYKTGGFFCIIEPPK